MISAGSQPADWLESTRYPSTISQTYIEIISVNILQINGCRVLSWIFIIDIADPVGCQVDMAILMVRNLELPAGVLVSACPP
jgi:hypothetical protein